jgi:hypothetical protein
VANQRATCFIRGTPSLDSAAGRREVRNYRHRAQRSLAVHTAASVAVADRQALPRKTGRRASICGTALDSHSAMEYSMYDFVLCFAVLGDLPYHVLDRSGLFL